MFKHALIQDAAYQSLLRSTRQQYHQRIAQSLEAQFTERRDAARTAGASLYRGGPRRAGHSLLAAGGPARHERSANVEAIGHLTKGLELLPASRTPGAQPARLALQIALGAPFMATRGLAHRKRESVYRPGAGALPAGGGDPQFFPVLRGPRAFLYQSGRIPDGAGVGEQLLRLAQRAQDPALLLQAHMALGCRVFSGRVRPCPRAL